MYYTAAEENWFINPAVRLQSNGDCIMLLKAVVILEMTPLNILEESLLLLLATSTLPSRVPSRPAPPTLAYALHFCFTRALQMKGPWGCQLFCKILSATILLHRNRICHRVSDNYHFLWSRSIENNTFWLPPNMAWQHPHWTGPDCSNQFWILEMQQKSRTLPGLW